MAQHDEAGDHDRDAIGGGAPEPIRPADCGEDDEQGHIAGDREKGHDDGVRSRQTSERYGATRCRQPAQRPSTLEAQQAEEGEGRGEPDEGLAEEDVAVIPGHGGKSEEERRPDRAAPGTSKLPSNQRNHEHGGGRDDRLVNGQQASAVTEEGVAGRNQRQDQERHRQAISGVGLVHVQQGVRDA